jgi:hypothetical protein
MSSVVQFVYADAQLPDILRGSCTTSVAFARPRRLLADLSVQ